MKQYLYIRLENPSLDTDFSSSVPYGKLKLGKNTIFWKKGFKWYHIEYEQITRIYRRVEHVYGKLCGGGDTYDIERLMLVLKNGEHVELVIGDRMKKEAVALMEHLQVSHPEIQYGKES